MEVVESGSYAARYSVHGAGGNARVAATRMCAVCAEEKTQREFSVVQYGELDSICSACADDSSSDLSSSGKKARVSCNSRTS